MATLQIRGLGFERNGEVIPAYLLCEAGDRTDGTLLLEVEAPEGRMAFDADGPTGTLISGDGSRTAKDGPFAAREWRISYRGSLTGEARYTRYDARSVIEAVRRAEEWRRTGHEPANERQREMASWRLLSGDLSRFEPKHHFAGVSL